MSARATHNFDESDVRIRPNKKGSRPRTKERPRHEDAVTAMVVGVDRGRWRCLVEGTAVTAMRARELGRTGIVVGDRVGLVGDVSGAEGTLARIVKVLDRRSVLRRTADDSDPVERIIVANADQLAIITALADPVPRPRMIDRCIVAAYDAGMDPLLVLTKADLADAQAFADQYAPLDVPFAVTQVTENPASASELMGRLQGRTTVFVGHSGVGKSTLVNALVPDADRATGVVNDNTGRGRHTSTSAVALALPGGGWVIDTPGVRSFGLAHIDPSRFIEHFPDLEPGTAECPRSCPHTLDAPECALPAWVQNGGGGAAGPSRLDSLHRLLAARD